MSDFTKLNETRQSCSGFEELLLPRDFLTNIYEVWNSIYGTDDPNRPERVDQLKTRLEELCHCIVEEEKLNKNNLVNEIEKKAHEAFNLERALGLPRKVDELGSPSEIPLIRLQEEVQQLLDDYYKVKGDRLSELSNLQAMENELCSILNQEPVINVALEGSPSETIPRLEDMEKWNDRIADLNQRKDALHENFKSYGEKLKQLMGELGIRPCRLFERLVFGLASERDYPVTMENMIKMKCRVEEYTNQKELMVGKADHLRNEIKQLWKKLQKDQFELDELIINRSDFKETTIQALTSVVEELRNERKMKIKDLILAQRKILDALWEKCCCSEQARAALSAYHSDHYTEDVLELHELEVERLENYYNKNRKIFELQQKHNELWERLLHLEELASDKNRLFNNRGGQLLKEEKERKTIQKKLPAIKAELVTLLNQFHVQNGKDFLYFGDPLIDIIQQMSQEREAAKENQKLQRKERNQQTVLQETRLGSRPVPTSGIKRKIQTPQASGKVMKFSNTASSTKSSATSHQSERGHVGMRRRLMSPVRLDMGSTTSLYATPLTTPVPPILPAASTPENGSLSYESFQEQIEKSKVKEAHSSTRNYPQRIGQQKHNDTMVLRPTASRVLKPSQNVNTMPSKTASKTPSKTPSKIPFRVATGSKIPSIVPPISPRGTSKLTTPRNKLPIIF